MISIEMITL